MAMKIDQPSRPQRGRRSSSKNVRKLLIEAAGRIFAEKGFDRATAKEIAVEAGTNAAAINYHFAGIENLYEQVLAEAHHRLLSYDALRTSVDMAETPEGKLRGFLEAALATISMPENEGWPLRVFTREIMSPTPFSHVLLTNEIFPKQLLLHEILGEILAVPVDDPIVKAASMNVLAPLVVTQLIDTGAARFTAAMEGSRAGADAAGNLIYVMSLGGLQALRDTLKR